jgi:hypothetical protein
VHRRHFGQKAKDKGCRQAALNSNIISESVQRLIFLFSHADVKPIPCPLGKAKEKAETTKLVQTNV